MGGVDAEDYTLKVLEELAKVNMRKIVVHSCLGFIHTRNYTLSHFLCIEIKSFSLIQMLRIWLKS